MNGTKAIKRLLAGLVAGSLLIVVQQSQGATSQSLGGITLTNVTPRIVTPNGDALNDVIFFRFDDVLSGLPIESSVFDVHGAKVGSLRIDSSDDTLLTWDGRDLSGNLMPAGIYIYMIEIGKSRATGTVVVAR
jgi:hypothetical protein